jgi:hypothetical protein
MPRPANRVSLRLRYGLPLRICLNIKLGFPLQVRWEWGRGRKVESGESEEEDGGEFHGCWDGADNGQILVAASWSLSVS